MNSPQRPKPASWLQVILRAPAPQAEAAADFIGQLSSHGVLLSNLSPDGGRMEVRGYLSSGPELEGQRRRLILYGEQLDRLAGGGVSLEFCDLEDQDWSANWRRHFRPQALTERLMVAPPWEPGRPADGQQVIIIDPGQAFGTGQHESTLICLRHLERLAAKAKLPSRLLDLGCGTGILALAGLLLGAQSALALDNDPLARQAARHNAGLNRLAKRLQVSGIPLDQLEERFGLLMANLTAGDLIRLAPDLARTLAPGGRLLAAGMLQTQSSEVARALADQGLRLLEQETLGQWTGLVMA